MATAREVAQWMVDQLEERTDLYQEEVVWQMKREFGDEFVYLNANGNYAISPAVLKEFRTLTESDVVWEKGSRMWRKRRPSDPEGRRQAE